MSKTISASAPRPAMPITSLTWTSRQARTQRLQWMQASRLTAIAGWLASAAAGLSPRGKPAFGPRRPCLGPVATAPDSGSCAMVARRLVGDQQLSITMARAPCGRARIARFRPPCLARVGGCTRRRACARPRPRPCTGAAIAVGAIARLFGVTEMGNVGAEALGDLPDRLARLGGHLFAVEGELEHLMIRSPRESGGRPTASGWRRRGRGRRSRRRTSRRRELD